MPKSGSKKYVAPTLMDEILPGHLAAMGKLMEKRREWMSGKPQSKKPRQQAQKIRQVQVRELQLEVEHTDQTMINTPSEDSLKHYNQILARTIRGRRMATVFDYAEGRTMQWR